MQRNNEHPRDNSMALVKIMGNNLIGLHAEFYTDEKDNKKQEIKKKYRNKYKKYKKLVREKMHSSLLSLYWLIDSRNDSGRKNSPVQWAWYCRIWEADCTWSERADSCTPASKSYSSITHVGRPDHGSPCCPPSRCERLSIRSHIRSARCSLSLQSLKHEINYN